MDAQSLYTIQQMISKWHKNMSGSLFAVKYVVLEMVEREGICSVSNISVTLSLSSKGVNEIVHGLLLSGLVQRIAGCEIALKLTPTGSKLLDSARKDRKRWIQSHFTRESMEELQVLFEQFSLMILSLDGDMNAEEVNITHS